MAWVRIDDGMPEHPKVLGLSDAAFRLHVTALCYAARHLTDGLIPHAFTTERRAAPLVVAGLWEVTDDGWRIHDYLEFNPSKEQVTGWTPRGRAGGVARSAHAPRVGGRFTSNITSKSPASTPATSPASHQRAPAPPLPLPLPVPSPERDSDQNPPTPLRVEFWNRACALRGLPSLNASDDSLLDSWIEHGVTIEVWDEVEREIAGWRTPPDHPWGAFKSAMGARVARGAAPRQLRAAPEPPHERTEAQRDAEAFAVEYKRIIRTEGVEAARRWAERRVTA